MLFNAVIYITAAINSSLSLSSLEHPCLLILIRQINLASHVSERQRKAAVQKIN